MRQIVLDTETTGLEVSQAHRIIEIGCIEINNRRATGRRFHQYINPEREIDAGAVEVHGLTLDDLKDRPLFPDIAGEFLEFVRGAELIIHNAPFDVGFINYELSLIGASWGSIEDYCEVFDTLKLGREMHPGQRNSLDALCRRYEIDNAHREQHGALLDAELLVEVYLAMTGGQVNLQLDNVGKRDAVTDTGQPHGGAPRQRRLVVVQPTDEELVAHRERLEAIDTVSGDGCVWLRQRD